LHNGRQIIACHGAIGVFHMGTSLLAEVPKGVLPFRGVFDVAYPLVRKVSQDDVSRHERSPYRLPPVLYPRFPLPATREYGTRLRESQSPACAALSWLRNSATRSLGPHAAAATEESSARAPWQFSVGSRTGAVPCGPSPAPATSNPACRFPAPGCPGRFASRVMRPIGQERFQARTRYRTR